MGAVDVDEMTTNGTIGKAGQKAPAPPPRKTAWFQLPAPVRQVFDKFPLVSYSANRLPQRAPQRRTEHVLYIFKDPQDTSTAGLSCNPSCLKWQAFLRFRNVELRLQAANNHASPSGALPFLLPALDGERPKSPVPASKLSRWLVAQGEPEEHSHIQEEAYMTLIDHNIRNAWLHYLYVDSDNFNSVAWPLYVASTSRSIAVQFASAHQLRKAAIDELLKISPLIDGNALYESAEAAFKALSVLLGTNKYFFDAKEPGLFDASLFAYTNLLLDRERKWQTINLVNILKDHDNLVAHRNRLLQRYFDG